MNCKERSLAKQFTRHAKLRSAQRNIFHEDIAKVIKYGSPLHRTAIVFYTIRKKDLKKMKVDRRETEKPEKLIKVYRDKKVFKKKWEAIGSKARSS